jgi:Cu/Zn superoxide dismutase
VQREPTFSSAGGHLKTTDERHGGHAGDLSSLLARRADQATLDTGDSGAWVACGETATRR